MCYSNRLCKHAVYPVQHGGNHLQTSNEKKNEAEQILKWQLQWFQWTWSYLCRRFFFIAQNICNAKQCENQLGACLWHFQPFWKNLENSCSILGISLLHVKRRWSFVSANFEHLHFQIKERPFLAGNTFPASIFPPARLHCYHAMGLKKNQCNDCDFVSSSKKAIQNPPTSFQPGVLHHKEESLF